MTKQRFLAIIYLLIGIILPAMAQTFTEQKKTYPVSADGSKYVVSGFTSFSIGKPVKGMTEDECRLAFGKPQTVLESNGEVQWMYSSSFYVFFKNGRVETIIK